MRATFRISEQDYVDGVKLFAKSTPRAVVLQGVAVLCMLAVFAFGPYETKGFAAGSLIGCIVVAVVMRFVGPLKSRSHYRKYKAIQDEFAVELIDDGVRFQSSQGDWKITWDKVLKWRQDAKWLLIYPMPRMYHMIPKSVAAQGFDLKALTDRLRQHVGEPEITRA